MKRTLYILICITALCSSPHLQGNAEVTPEGLAQLVADQMMVAPLDRNNFTRHISTYIRVVLFKSRSRCRMPLRERSCVIGTGQPLAMPYTRDYHGFTHTFTWRGNGLQIQSEEHLLPYCAALLCRKERR